MLQRGGAVFVRVGRLRVELDRRFDGERPGGQRQCQLCPDTLRCAGQQGKLPAQLAAIPAAEQQPRLRTAQKAAAVFEPALPFRQAAAIVLDGQADVLPGLPQAHLDVPAGRGGTQGVRKQVEADLFGHFPVAPDKALLQPAAVYGELRAALGVDLAAQPFQLRQQAAQVHRPLLHRFLRSRKLHQLPERPFQPGCFLLHVLQRLGRAGILQRLQVHL